MVSSVTLGSARIVRVVSKIAKVALKGVRANFNVNEFSSVKVDPPDILIVPSWYVGLRMRTKII